MTVGQILNYNRSIRVIIDNSPDMNALVKYRLLGMLKQFEPAMQNYEEVRNDLIKKYGTVNESGNIGIYYPQEEDYGDKKRYEEAVKEHEEIVEKFDTALEEILNSESDIVVNKFKYTDIMNAGLSTDYLVVLYDLIEE